MVAIGTVVVEIEWSLVNHVILQDLMIKASCDFSDRSPSKQIIILPSFDHRHSGSGDIMCLSHDLGKIRD